jgi:hypothetical protein
MTATTRRALRALGLTFLALLLTGCAALEPDAIRLEAGHQSTIGQHFTSQPSDYGMETLGVAARWQRGRWVAEISEAYAVSGIDACARLCPTRDVFNATVGYDLWVRP